jgi:hypothetical protein
MRAARVGVELASAFAGGRAIMSLRRITDGKLNQSELILVYDPKAGWQPHRPSVKNENLEPDKR